MDEGEEKYSKASEAIDLKAYSHKISSQTGSRGFPGPAKHLPQFGVEMREDAKSLTTIQTPVSDPKYSREMSSLK